MEKNEKDEYYKYTSDMWMKNKGKYIRKNGCCGGYYYICSEEGCEEPRTLNKKKDLEYEISELPENFGDILFHTEKF